MTHQPTEAEKKMKVMHDAGQLGLMERTYFLEQVAWKFTVSNITQNKKMSAKGLELLKNYETPWQTERLKKDVNGNIVAIRNHDIGDGGITVGYGRYVPYDDIQMQKFLNDTYGIDATSTDEFIDIKTATRLLADTIKPFEEKVIHLEQEMSKKLSQNEFDALVLLSYNTWNIPKTVKELLEKPNFTSEELTESILIHYKKNNSWDKFNSGWTNRTLDTVELYFDNDYERTH